MNNHYTLENKPSFKDQEMILVDMSVLNAPGLGTLKGKVVGKATEHIFDVWIIEFENRFPSYPYKTLNVIHTAIINEK